MKPLRSTIFIATLAIFFFSACKQDASHNSSTAIQGVYEQLGYGKIAKIGASGNFILYDITKVSCLPIMEDSITIFGDNLSIHNDTLKIKDGINEYHFVRMTSAPDLCNEELSDARKKDPIYNFEVLAETFETHYAYFELRGVNWDSLRSATRAKIKPDTSEAELHMLMEDMLDEFNDGHIGLEATSEVERAADSLRNIVNVKNDEENNLKEYGDFQIARMVAEHYLKDNLKSTQSELINWGLFNNDTGYIQINLMMGHANLNLADSLRGMPYLRTYFGELEDLTSEEHTKLEVKGIRASLDKIMDEFEDTKALVLDVRFNGGGKDEVGMEIIRHFNPTKHLVFTKKARKGNAYTETNNIYLDADTEPYRKAVYLLMSPQSASATEIMVMSTLQLKHIVRAGGHTEGVFSDVLDKVLPNEWIVGLSNEVYLDTKGNNYEGKGIPANIDLGYSEDRQDFFRSIANDLEGDRKKILDILPK